MAHPTLPPHVVVIGGGFGGLWTTRALAHAPVRVTLIDRTNHHLFDPLLYQVAAASLSGTDISAPLRHIVRRQRNATVWMDEVTAIAPDKHQITTRRGTVDYDYLVLASGSECSYFGHPEWAAQAPGLKTLDDALVIRRRVLSAFERAEIEPDAARRAALLGFVIVGGGPTGVELAGTLAEMAQHTLRHEFRSVQPAQSRIHLVEAGPRILPALPTRLSQRARRELERMGVAVHTGSAVTQITHDGVQLGDERIRAATTLWAAGVAASPLARQLGAPCDRAGRVEVGADLTVAGHPEIFAIGDLAQVTCAGQRVPGVAPAAKQMGRYAGHAICARVARQPARPFRYRDWGTLACINRSSAMVKLHALQLSGTAGWLFWLLAHIFFLIGFRNRMAVMWNWMWSYFNWQRTARIITGHDATAEEADLARGAAPASANNAHPAAPRTAYREQDKPSPSGHSLQRERATGGCWRGLRWLRVMGGRES